MYVRSNIWQKCNCFMYVLWMQGLSLVTPLVELKVIKWLGRSGHQSYKKLFELVDRQQRWTGILKISETLTCQGTDFEDS